MGSSAGSRLGELVADGCQLVAVGAHGVAVVGVKVARRPCVGVALECLFDPVRQAGFSGLGVRGLAQRRAGGHLAAAPGQQERVVGDEHALDGLQARSPARFKALEHTGAQQSGQLGLDGQLVLGLQVKGARAVAGHRQCVDGAGDAVQQAGVSGVEVVAPRRQPRPWEAHGGAVGELLAGVFGLDEGAVAADADRVGEREEHVGVQALGVALVRAGGEEQVADGVDAARRERLVVAGEQHHEVVEVPQPVVDRRGREQHRLLA